MRYLILVLLMVMPLTGLAQGPSRSAPPLCSGVNGLSASEIEQILAAHNKVREQYKLPTLTWDCKLANFAQEWATRGLAEHREYCNFGESIFVSSMESLVPDLPVKTWLNEGQFWNNQAGTCQAGKMCNHFTQLVWKRTTQVGCGINTHLSGRWKTMLVCNYNPAGNTPGPAY